MPQYTEYVLISSLISLESNGGCRLQGWDNYCKRKESSIHYNTIDIWLQFPECIIIKLKCHPHPNLPSLCIWLHGVVPAGTDLPPSGSGSTNRTGSGIGLESDSPRRLITCSKVSAFLVSPIISSGRNNSAKSREMRTQNKKNKQQLARMIYFSYNLQSNWGTKRWQLY